MSSCAHRLTVPRGKWSTRLVTHYECTRLSHTGRKHSASIQPIQRERVGHLAKLPAKRSDDSLVRIYTAPLSVLVLLKSWPLNWWPPWHIHLLNASTPSGKLCVLSPSVSSPPPQLFVSRGLHSALTDLRQSDSNVHASLHACTSKYPLKSLIAERPHRLI